MSRNTLARPESTVAGSDSEAVTFSVKDARNASGPLKDLDSAIATVKAGKVEADRKAGHVMWNAALLTHSAVTSGHVGAGKDATMKQGDYAKAIGFSEGYVTALKDLGRAAVVHGVKRGTREWGVLCMTVDKQPRVKTAIRAESTDEYKRLIAPLVAEWESTGKISKGAATPRLDDGGDKSGDTGDTDKPESPEVTITLTPSQALDAALQTLDQALKALPVDDREAFAAAESRIEAMLAREITLRVAVVAESA